jgi:hypothetical protein
VTVVPYNAKDLRVFIGGLELPAPTPPIVEAVATGPKTLTVNVTCRLVPFDWAALRRKLEDLDFDVRSRSRSRKMRRSYQGNHARWSYEGRKLAKRDYTPTPKGGEL